MYTTLTAILGILFALNSYRFLKANLTPSVRRTEVTKSGKWHFKNYRFDLAFMSWVLSNLLLVFSNKILLTIFISLLQTIFAYYFVIKTRHSHIFRGFGAPGHFQFILCFSNSIFAISSMVSKNLVANMADIFVIELGIIFIVSGFYKFFSGYRKWRGIEVGLYNPLWSYYPRFWIQLRQKKKLIPIVNFFSVWGEILGGLLLLHPTYNVYGALIISIMFIFVMLNVRLGSLVPTIIVTVFAPLISTNYSPIEFIFEYQVPLENFLVYSGYIIIIINSINYLILNFNFYSRKKLSRNYIQNLSDFWTRATGQCLWRVFTSDITSIHIAIDNQKNVDFLSNYERKVFSRKSCVLESITLVSIFTSLKYSEGEQEFKKRLEKYASSHEILDGLTINVNYIDSTENGYKLIPAVKICFYLEGLDISKLEGYNLIAEPDRYSKVYKGRSIGVYTK